MDSIATGFISIATEMVTIATTLVSIATTIVLPQKLISERKIEAFLPISNQFEAGKHSVMLT